MAEESFVLVSLKESKAKKLAQIISNEACRKILDHLSRKTATETELSKILDMPISTVHYNIQHLMENKLITAEEFHYSQKGKEVLHYKLANKLIIIAPAGADQNMMDKLKSLWPISALIVAATVAVGYISKVYSGSAVSTAPMIARTASAADVSVSSASNFAAAPMLAAQKTAGASQSFININSIAVWFFIGAIFAMTAYFIIERFRKQK